MGGKNAPTRRRQPAGRGAIAERSGMARKRAAAEFDPEFYLKMYPETGKFQDLYNHYANTGWLEGRDPNAQFSVRKYLAKHRDVLDSGEEPLYHYVRHGIAEGRAKFPSDATPKADPVDELIERTNEDEILRGGSSTKPIIARPIRNCHRWADCFAHYMKIGWKEGRNPSRYFDTDYYLGREGDIRKAGINPFRHFVLHGTGRRAPRSTGCRGCSARNSSRKVSG